MVVLFCVCVGFVLWLRLYTSGTSTKETLYLAVAGPMSGSSAQTGLDMVRSVQLYLDEVNRAGGIDGQPVQLLVIDDQNDAEVARQKAQDLVEQPGLMAVIGHYTSDASLAVADIYRQAGIPAITGSATADSLTGENDWYFRTIFNNQSQGVYLANYMRRLMRYTNAKIIYDTDRYGSSLATTFEEAFTGLGGEVKTKWHFDTADEQLDLRLEQIVREFTADNSDSSDILFLAAHSAEAAKLVVGLRQRGVSNVLFGGDALSSTSFAQRIAQYPEEQAWPGYFSEGMYAISPLLFDLASNTAQDFRIAFIEAYNTEPTWVAATYYDVAQIAVRAIEQAGVSSTGENLAAERSAVHQQLASFNTPTNSLAGVSGDVYFDLQGNNQQVPAMGIYSKGTLVAAPVQLQAVADITQVPNIEQALANEDILLVNGKYMYQIDVVYTGIDLNEVSNLADDGISYTVDFYIWFRARTGIDAENIEFLNYAVDRVLSGERVELGEPIATKTEHGMTYNTYRLKADFSSDFDFEAYPFDQQTLSIQFRHLTATRNRLIYVVDQAGLGDTSPAGMIARLERSDALSMLDDWYIIGAQFFQDTLNNHSTLGDPTLNAEGANIPYSRFNLEVEIHRNVLNFITRTMLPVFFIILLSYLSFYLPKLDFEDLIPILTGTVLTIVFFHIDVGNDIGESYTVALDYVFYVLYAMFVLQLLLALIAWRAKSPQTKRRISLIVKLSYPLIVCVTAIVFTATYTEFFQPKLATLTTLGRNQQLTRQPLATNPSLIPPQSTTGGEGSAMPAEAETVTLRFGSWRIQDEAAMKRILAVFNREHPSIVVQWESMAPTTYIDILTRQLAKGVAPDLFYLDSFSAGETFWNAGNVASLADVASLNTNFSAGERAPWATDEGIPYAVPFIATAYGIYYNVDLFTEIGITPPTTWESLLEAARAIQNAGYTPFANGIQEEWTVNEMFFMNLAPNFIGGQSGRFAYLTGQRCFNDTHSIAAFEAVAQLAPFLPDRKETLNFADSRQLFLEGETAMFMADSKELPTLEAFQPPFAWDVMAMPAPEGQPTVVNFTPTVGLALNAASAHPDQARIFLSWLATPAAEALLNQELPGLFTPRQDLTNAPNPHVQPFLDLLSTHETDIGWAWQELIAKQPNGYSLMTENAIAVIQGEKTPQEAADGLQNGLAQWYRPAQQCLLIE